MTHTLAKRLHADEKQVRAFLETALIEYGVLLSAVLVLTGIAVAIMYLQT